MPPKKWETEWKWLLVAALAIVMCNMFLANHAYGQNVSISVDSTMQGNDGLTQCDSMNKPYIVIRGGMSNEDVRMTLLHEYVHVRQMAGDCHAIMAKYVASATVRVQLESEAYCTALDFEPNMDKREFDLDKLTLWMFGQYGQGEMLYSQVKEIVHRNCNKMRGTPP